MSNSHVLEELPPSRCCTSNTCFVCLGYTESIKGVHFIAKTPAADRLGRVEGALGGGLNARRALLFLFLGQGPFS